MNQKYDMILILPEVAGSDQAAESKLDERRVIEYGFGTMKPHKTKLSLESNNSLTITYNKRRAAPVGAAFSFAVEEVMLMTC